MRLIFRLLLLFLLLFSALFYGVLIGKYRCFPYQLIKDYQDKLNEEGMYASRIEAYPPISPDSILTTNVSNIDSMKKMLSYLVFGDSINVTFPLPDIADTMDVRYNDFKNLLEIQRFEVSMKYNLKSIGYIFRPKASNRKLILYHQGHEGDFYSGKNTIKYFLEKGFTIYAFSLPLIGMNNQPFIYKPKLGYFKMNSHDKFQFLENPLSYFLFPVISMISYSEIEKFDKRFMVGISGGGWATTMVAALDDRLDGVFPVAGTYPMYLKFKMKDGSFGDFEQYWSTLHSRIDYLDIYLMGSIQKNRVHVQINNMYDPCCFSGTYSLEYKDLISKEVKKFNSGGDFSVYIDSFNTEHKISNSILEHINHIINK